MQRATEAQEAGDFESAEAAYSELTVRFPRFPDAWHYYGILLHQRGEHERGLELLRRADRLDPRNLVFLLNLASVLRDQRRLEESLTVLRRAHDLDAEHAQVFTQLAQIHLLVQRGGDLIADVELRIEREPGNWHLWLLLGECLEQGGERERAFEAFTEAARLAPPGETSAHGRRAWAARAAGDAQRAEAAFRDAAEVDPASGWAFVGLATMASERGDFERSTVLARKALELDASCHAAWRLLANTDPARDRDGFVRELEDAAAAAGDDPRAWLLHFARGQAWERREEYDRAFAAYALGNSQRSRHRPYSRIDQNAYVRDILGHLDRDFTRRAERIGAACPGAIFVCGMPRSGTTLVESVLASHPEVSAGGEMRHIHDQLRRRLREGAQARVGSWLARAGDRELRDLAEGWKEALEQTAAGRPRVTDKMPGNFMLLGFVHACLPEARIVHVHRDPRDTSLSCFTTPFSEGLEFSFDLEDIGYFYRDYLALMDHWRRVLGPDRIIEIGYESLARDPEPEIRRLLAALDLDWDPRCLDFHRTSRVVSTASVFQVRQPLYTRSIGRWRHFQRHLAPLLRVLGSRPG